MRIVTLYELNSNDVIEAIAEKFNVTVDNVSISGADKGQFKVLVEKETQSLPKQEVSVIPVTHDLVSVIKEYSNTPPEAHLEDNTSQVISEWVVDDSAADEAVERLQSKSDNITVTVSTDPIPAPDYEHSNVGPIRIVEASTEQRSQRDIDEANFAKITDDILIAAIQQGASIASICESYDLPVKYRQRLYKHIEELRSEGASLPELKRGRRDTSSASGDQLSGVD